MRTLTFLTLLAAAATAQDLKPSLSCDTNNRGNRDARHCEMREQTLGYGGALTIDGKTNGGVTVRGWNRSDVLVRMKVEAGAPTEAEARAIASQVQTRASAGRVDADGPEGGDHRYWSVSYEVFAPSRANVDVKTKNGGIKIADITGTLRFNAVNGGVTLANIGGDVQGRTTNGGLTVKLAGRAWEGSGMDVATTNGGVNLQMPEAYSAQVESSTVNGGFSSDFPGLVRGTDDRHVKLTLGNGGAPIKVTTQNGGVKVTRI